jgi:hypothetical protein
MAERLKAPVLKTGKGQLFVGSNPTLSAFKFVLILTILLFFNFHFTIFKKQFFGEMAERLKAPVSKTGKGQLFVGSNPTLSVFTMIITE